MLSITPLRYLNIITQTPLFRMEFETYGGTIEAIARHGHI